MNWLRRKPKLETKDLGNGFALVFQKRLTDSEQIRAVVKSPNGSIYCRGPIVSRTKSRDTARIAVALFHRQRDGALNREMVSYSPSWVERSWGKRQPTRTALVSTGFSDSLKGCLAASMVLTFCAFWALVIAAVVIWAWRVVFG